MKRIGSQQGDWRWARRIALLATGYAVTGALGLAAPYLGSSITLIWLPSGIAVAALWLWGWRSWPGIALGALLVNLNAGSSLLTAAGIAVGNTLGPLLAVWLLRQQHFCPSFAQRRDIAWLAAAAAVGMLLSASNGAWQLCLAGVLPWQQFGNAWLTWWLGDSMGVLLAAPFLLNLNDDGRQGIRQRRQEFSLWCALAATVALAAFALNSGHEGGSLPLAFLPLPLVAWAALRFGPLGTALAVLGLSLVAIFSTALGYGPFYRPSPQLGLLLCWAYMVTVATLGWLTNVLQRERSLTASLLRSRELALRSMSQGTMISGVDRRISYVNPAFERITGYSAAELLGRTAALLQGPATAAATVAELRAALAAGAAFHGEILNYRKDGRPFWNELTITPVRDELGQLVEFVGILRDVSERRQNEKQIRSLNRLYRLLSNINQLIVHRPEPQQLFSEVCAIAVRDGGFRMAWIGLLDEARQQVSPVASAGETGDYLAQLQVTLAGPYGNGPTGSALRHGQPQVCNDIAADPVMAPWREAALALGYRASAAFPLLVRGELRGTLNLYAAEPGFFDEKEYALLLELSDDLAFALAVYDGDVRLRQAAIVFDNTGEGILVTDAQNRIVMVNRAFSELTGYSEAEALGQTPTLLRSGRHDAAFYQTLWQTLHDSGHWQGEVWNRRKNGDIYPELLSISAIRDQSGLVSHYVGVFADLSRLRNSEAQLDFLAHHDPLTGLPNRLLLTSRLEHSIAVARREQRQLALLVLDLDRFKDINDSFGHLTGDELLQQVAKRLQQRLRSADTVSRLGGDEFTVLLEDIAQPEDAARVASEIIVSLSAPWRLANGAEARLGVSIGISLFPAHGGSAEALLQQADAALYQAKDEGRSHYRYFSEEMTQAARTRIELEAQLRHAISGNELCLYYQPQVDMESGRIVGAEALVRWQHPEYGLLPPAKFIAVAEATGLIGALGDWVLRETCRQGRQWQQAGLSAITLAVNVSPCQLLQGDIAADVARVLRETGFPAERLELELTESALMERQDEAVRLLNRLRAQGVRLAIDDFGTGYSSLAYLKRFPLDVLKIDKSFVDDIPQSQDDMQIAATIIAMAHTLRFKVLAEGVETPAQLAFLQRQGCDFYQGYLKSPPLPAPAFARLLAASREISRLTALPLDSAA